MLAKSKLNSISVLISKTLIDADIIHNEFVSANSVLEVIKNHNRVEIWLIE